MGDRGDNQRRGRSPLSQFFKSSRKIGRTQHLPSPTISALINGGYPKAAILEWHAKERSDGQSGQSRDKAETTSVGKAQLAEYDIDSA